MLQATKLGTPLGKGLRHHSQRSLMHREDISFGKASREDGYTIPELEKVVPPLKISPGCHVQTDIMMRESDHMQEGKQ